MRDKYERFDDVWLDRLDGITSGIDEPSPEDDELLHLAGRLTAAFSPLRELDAPARARRQRLAMQLRAQVASLPHGAHAWKKWLLRPLVAAVAVLLFLLLGPGLIFELKPAGSNSGTHHNKTTHSWQAANLPPDYSFAIAPPKDIPHGLTLLLPLNLPSNAYLISLNTGKYGSNSPTATYLVFTLNAHLYESPVQPLPSSAYLNSAYTSIQLGALNGILLQAGDGQNRIEWYEQGLLCDLVSYLPVSTMVSMIEDLRPITYH